VRQTASVLPLSHLPLAQTLTLRLVRIPTTPMQPGGFPSAAPTVLSMTFGPCRWEPADGPPSPEAAVSIAPRSSGRRSRFRLGFLAALVAVAAVGISTQRSQTFGETLDAAGARLTPAERACADAAFRSGGSAPDWREMGVTQRAAAWRTIAGCTDRLPDVAVPLVAPSLGLDPASPEARCATENVLAELGPSYLASDDFVAASVHVCTNG
jgi:hypothetical protein